jgi:uncharacterized protein (UPF0335 family)
MLDEDHQGPIIKDEEELRGMIDKLEKLEDMKNLLKAMKTVLRLMKKANKS